jgi:hypothetical protein
LRHPSFSTALVVSALAGALVLTGAGSATPARADQATDKARGHYETGLELFYAREHAQALIEFQRAHEVKPRPATLFMMGQCEYLLGAIRQARDHYQAYLAESASGEFVEVAKDRIESINRRPATLAINTVPDQVDVRITVAPQAEPRPSSRAIPSSEMPTSVTGQAPNNFAVPRGRWLIAVSKANYLSQQMTVDVEVGDTKPLFFKLEPIPARLEIETLPAGATLYVNGNRALNPYRQSVPPGRYEIFGEATNYEDRTGDFVLGPGEKRLFVGPNAAFRLRYVQRSGRPELVLASALMGGLVGAGALAGTVAAAQETNPLNSAVGLVFGGALAGTIGGALVANRVVPVYIPDNRALFVIGGMWIGAAEGMLTGMVVSQAMSPEVAATVTTPAYLPRPTLSSQLKAAFLSSLPGIVVGTTGAALLTKRAPTYGRVALIQSAAVGGAVVGGLAAVALKWNLRDWKAAPPAGSDQATPADTSLLDLSLPALVGLNVGLAGGLLGAYMPDQSRYGPSWQRIALIDLAAGATGLAFWIGACVGPDSNCLTSSPEAPSRAHTAALALLGSGVGLLGGILLTRNVDQEIRAAPTSTPPPSLTLLPAPDGRGGVTPTIGVMGLF